MNKAEFITGVASKADLTKKDAEIAINAVIAQLSEAFSKGEDVAFIGFGTFKVSTRKARIGRKLFLLKLGPNWKRSCKTLKKNITNFMSKTDFPFANKQRKFLP